MEDIVRADIIKIIDECIGVIEKGDLLQLERISNHTIHNASIFQDEFSISIAVIIASIAKIAKQTGKVSPEIIFRLRASKECLERSKIGEYCDDIKNISEYLKTVDDKVHAYVQEVIVRAQIKKGSKIYDHGISLARAAELLGLSQWELMNYIGKTGLIDHNGAVKENLEEKLSFIRDLFSLEKGQDPSRKEEHHNEHQQDHHEHQQKYQQEHQQQEERAEGDQR